MDYDYNDLPGLNGDDNMGGYKQKVLVAPVSWFATLKGFKLTTLPGDSVTIDGDHTFNANKGFVELYTTYKTAKLASEMVGEEDGLADQFTFEAVHPGNKKLAAEFARRAKNDDFIVLLPDIDGTHVQLGLPDLPAKIRSKFDSGTIDSGRKARTLTISSIANSMAFYEGVITLKPEVVVP